MLRLAAAACVGAVASASQAPPVPPAPLGADGLLKGVRFDNDTDLELKLKQSLQYLKDFQSGNNTSTGCSGGLKNMPVCYQICDEWCWATVTTMTSDYYKGQNYCQGFECAVASHEFGQQCCPYTNSCRNTPSDPQTTCNSGGTPQQMADAASFFTGGPFKVYGALSQQQLDSALAGGRVVMIAVYWQGGGGHALLIGGCSGGSYYLHDPWGWYQQAPAQWQSLDYAGLLQYHAPNGGIGAWTYSIAWDLGAEDSHQAAVERASTAQKQGGKLPFVV